MNAGVDACAVGRQPGNRHLHPDMAVAFGHRLAGVVLDLLEVAASNVGIHRRGEAAFSAQQLIDGHVGSLALDVPERHVHTAHRVEEHRAVPPVRAHVGGLPDVLDLVDVPTQEERLEILVDRRLHDASPLGEGRTTQAVEARLARRDLDDDQADPIGSGEDRLDVGDLEWRQAPRRLRLWRDGLRQGRLSRAE